MQLPEPSTISAELSAERALSGAASSSSASSGTLSALSAEIVECREASEILEIVAEEAGLLTGQAVVLALQRLAQCPREQHALLRGSAAFANLLALLEEQAPELGPKVSPSHSSSVSIATWRMAPCCPLNDGPFL